MCIRDRDTVYFGGGTPTSLKASQLDALITRLKETFPFDQVKEFTVEAGRPDSITEEKFAVLKKHGVTRISINPQTMNQKTLDLIGRRHTVEMVEELSLIHILSHSFFFSSLHLVGFISVKPCMASLYQIAQVSATDWREAESPVLL